MSRVAYHRTVPYAARYFVRFRTIVCSAIAICILTLCTGCNGRNEEGIGRKQAASKIASVTSEDALIGEAFRVGVLYPTGNASGFQQPFRDLIQQAANANSLHLEVESANMAPPALEQATARLAERNVQAILVCGVVEAKVLAQIARERNTPVFVIPTEEGTRSSLQAAPGITTITADDGDAGQLAAEQIGRLLHNTGNVVIVGETKDPATTRRLNVFGMKLTRNKSRIKIEKLPDLPDEHQETARLQQLLQRKQDAVKALVAANPQANNTIAAVLRTVRRSDMAVCRVYASSSALMEVQNSQQTATISAPATTEIGQVAMEAIAATLRGEKTPTQVLVRPLLTLEANSHDTPTLIPTGFHAPLQPVGKNR